MGLIETLHAGAFLICEEQGCYSRDKGVVAAGQRFVAGTVLAFDDDGLLVALTDEDDAAGIAFDAVDATEAATPATYVSRVARVHLASLAYPEEREDDVIAALSALRIEVSPPISLSVGGGGGGDWLLSGGAWNDAGVWDDSASWEDAA